MNDEEKKIVALGALLNPIVLFSSVVIMTYEWVDEANAGGVNRTIDDGVCSWNKQVLIMACAHGEAMLIIKQVLIQLF